MIYNSFKYYKENYFIIKVIDWFKLITITGAKQFFIQILGFLSGILIIRLLPVQEYAYYTLANTMLGTMTILADGGISNGVMSQGSKVWQDKDKLGVVLATGLDLRKKFALITLIFVTPTIIYLLLKINASWLSSILILLSLIPAFYAALSDSLFEIVPKLHQDISSLQNNKLKVDFGRLLLTLFTIFIFPWTFIIILASGLPRMYGNIKLKRINSNFVNINQEPDPLVRKEILSVVARILPNIIFYSLSGQIVIWVLSIFGNTNDLASIGALGRFSLITGFFSSILTTLFIPRFSRLSYYKSKLIIYYLFFQLILFLFSGFIILIVFIFPIQILWILGSSYSGLSTELFLILLSNCIGLISSMTGNLVGSRGYFLNPILLTIMNLSTLIFAYFIWDLSTLLGMLYYSILYQCVSLTVNYIYSFNIFYLNKK
jgi:O-antigen/teichoic acid export membrane protein